MLIREIKPEDAEELIAIIKQVEKESSYMLMEPGERQTTPEQQRQHLERISQESHSIVFAAEIEGRLVGYLMAIGGSVRKTSHSVYLVIGILNDYKRRGIGTALFERVEAWAKTKSIRRLELTVVKENKPGVALYTKSGFEIEGTKRKSLLIDDRLCDEYLMSKLL